MKASKKSKNHKTRLVEPYKVETLPVTIQATTGIVRLSNLRTGRVVRMGAKAATMLSTKYPQEFKIP